MFNFILGAVPRKQHYFTVTSESQFGPGELSDVFCSGNESRLVDCQHTGVANQTCRQTAYDNDGIGISCLPPGTEPSK